MASSSRRKSGQNSTGFARKESTGSPKKQSISRPSASNSSATTSTGAETGRVRELEQQVTELKKRLDKLRKAKSQTIVKKDKEYVTLDAPQLGQKPSVSSQDLNSYKEQIRELQGKLKQVEKDKAKEVENPRAEISQLKLQMEQKNEVTVVKDEEELRRLRQQIKSLQEERDGLKAQNTDLQIHNDEMLEALSKKEAQWCDREEKLTQEIKLSWQEKYHQWMAQTEKKIGELQMANNFLRQIIDRGKPE